MHLSDNGRTYGGDASDIVDSPDDAVLMTTFNKAYGVSPEPVPMSKVRPRWDASEYPETVEAALSLGWCARSVAEVEVNAEGDELAWKSKFDENKPYSQHPSAQTGEMPIPINVGKFHSYWTTHMPEGYSMLLTDPLGRWDERFTPFSGCVDYDVFPSISHMPHVVHIDGQTKFRDGVPIGQMIPFRRDKLLGTATTREATEKEARELRSDTNETGSVIEFKTDTVDVF